jgi:hypothetical protein
MIARFIIAASQPWSFRDKVDNNLDPALVDFYQPHVLDLVGNIEAST